jgi:hypothetical protein
MPQFNNVSFRIMRLSQPYCMMIAGTGQDLLQPRKKRRRMAQGKELYGLCADEVVLDTVI